MCRSKHPSAKGVLSHSGPLGHSCSTHEQASDINTYSTYEEVSFCCMGFLLSCSLQERMPASIGHPCSQSQILSALLLPHPE